VCLDYHREQNPVHVLQAEGGAFLLGNANLHIPNWSCNGRENFGMTFLKLFFRNKYKLNVPKSGLSLALLVAVYIFLLVN